MTEKKRISLSLYMSSPLQREAWSILSALPARQRTETICLALCRAHERDAVMDMVRQAIREDGCAAQHEPKKAPWSNRGPGMSETTSSTFCARSKTTEVTLHERDRHHGSALWR